MKQPKLNDLTIDLEGTRKLRSQLSKTKKIKITIKIDERSLTLLRKVSRQSTPLRFLYQAIRDGATSTGETKARLDRIEKELQKLKRQIAA
jgi:predicted translin family RNA/ssDNA-binding protein